MNQHPPAHHIQAVKQFLGFSPKKAPEIAQEAGIDDESCYRALVWLYDRQEAAISRGVGCNGRGGKIDGWIEGINA